MPVAIQLATTSEAVPDLRLIESWALQALVDALPGAAVTVRIVGIDEGRALNKQWRNGESATNVLAFPIEGLAEHPELLGDIVICAEVANVEALGGHDSCEAHWAHLVVHGVLHLRGFDHIDDADATEMESLERTILADLGYPDPYL